MKSYKTWVFLLLPIIIALSLPRLLGGKIASEVEAHNLVLVARDDVRVRQFVYHPGWFQGHLEYDLTLQITQPDMQAAFAEFDPDFDNTLHLKGSLPIQQGPWVGGPFGFALAATEWTLPLPEALRDALPQYPGQAPVLSLSAAMTLGGKLRAELQSIGYQGKFVIDYLDQAIDVVLEPLQLLVNIEPNQQQFDFVLDLPKISFDVVEAGERVYFSLESLRLDGDYRLLMPFVWIGQGALQTDAIHAHGGTTKLHLNDIALLAATRHKNGQITNETAFKTGAIDVEFDDHKVSLANTELVLSLSQLSVEPYAELVRLHDQYAKSGYALDVSEDDAADAEQALRELLAGHPTLSLERLGFHMNDGGGFNANFSLTFAGDEHIDWSDIEALIDAVQLDARAHLDTSALKSIVTLLQTDDTTSADSTYFATLAVLSDMPWLKIDAQHIVSTLRFSDGALTINNQSFEDFLPLLDLAWTGLSSMFADEPLVEDYAGSISPDLYGSFEKHSESIQLWAEPLFGRYALVTGYENDPFLVEIAAGGNANLNVEVADTCLGWVNASGPDVVVDFIAGPYPFSIYAFTPDGTDTTLAVIDPSGYWYCSDDHPNLGLNPGIEFHQPLTGEYRVWVGTHDASVTFTELYFTEESLD